MPESALSDMSFRDLMVQTAQKVIGIEDTVVKLEVHAAATNGHIADILKEQYIQRGGIGMLRWMVMAAIAGIGTGAAVAMVILVLVAK